MSKEDKNKLLIDFFAKDLSNEQKQVFLKKAASDKGFIKEFVKGVEVNEVFEELYGKKEGKDENRRCSKVQVLKVLSIILATAAVIVFGLIIGINRYQESKNPGEAIFNTYYEPFDLSLTRSVSGTKSLAYLYSCYIMKDYQTIHQTKIDELQMEDSKGIINIIYAISAIELNQYELAEKFLDIISTEDSYYLISIWYKGILLIRNGEFQKADELIKKVSGNSLIFRQDALEIQAYLERKHLIN